MCGVIGHIERDCLAIDEDDRTDEKQWGSWLRASSQRGRQRIADEAKKFLSCPRVLSFESTGRELGKGNRSVLIALSGA